jgi:hypothetical protein
MSACLEGTPTSQEWRGFVQHLHRNDSLRNLKVNTDSIDGDRLQSLLTSLKESRVNDITICLNHDVAGLTRVVANALPNLLSIHGLTIRWCGNNMGLSSLAAALCTSKLFRLSLQPTDQGPAQICPMGMKTLMQGLRTSKVSRLSFDGCVLGDEVAQALAMGLPFTSVRDLNLARTSLTNEGIKAISAVLKDSNLEVLRICGNTFGTSGLEALAAGVRDTAITHMTYIHNIRHEELEHLRQIKEALQANESRPFLLQMEVEELVETEPMEWQLTFRTMAGTVAATLTWSSECPDDGLPSQVFRAMQIGNFPLPSRHLREWNLRFILPNGQELHPRDDLAHELSVQSTQKRRRLC